VKASKFFFVCERHMVPDMRVKIPAAMMVKGYPNKESKNRMLQIQVCREVKKIRGLDPPCPYKAVAAAATAGACCCGAGEHCAPAAEADLPLCHADPALQMLGQFFKRFGITECDLVEEGL
jgi:hypothetical protein